MVCACLNKKPFRKPVSKPSDGIPVTLGTFSLLSRYTLKVNLRKTQNYISCTPFTYKMCNFIQIPLSFYYLYEDNYYVDDCYSPVQFLFAYWQVSLLSNLRCDVRIETNQNLSGIILKIVLLYILFVAKFKTNQSTLI